MAEEQKPSGSAPEDGTAAFVDNVIGRQSDSDQGWGLSVCFAGMSTNAVSCGFVTTYVKTILPNGVGNLMCTSASAEHGDSGGPVYVPYPGNEGKAAGLVSSEYIGNMCYATIDSVLQGMTNRLGGGTAPAYVLDADGSLS